MRPPFCRIGSKRDIADKVIALFPEHEIYVEPFIGSGAIYWVKTPSKKEVINDLDSELINNYKLLKKTKARNFRKDLNTLPKLRAFDKEPHTSEADKLIWGIVNGCNRFMGFPTGKIYKESNPYSKLENIEEYQERLKNTSIYNQSYEKIISKYDSPKTFFYLDPPYEKSEGLYKHSEFDYVKFRDVLSKTKGKWLVSINDSKYIRDIFKDFNIKPIVVKAKSASNSVGSKDRKELFIANYDI